MALFLSATGYSKLGVAPEKVQGIRNSSAGSRAATALSRIAVRQVGGHVQSDVDLLLLVGNDSANEAAKTVKDLLKIKPPTIVELGREIGIAYKNANGDGIEHFGYVDGRSQPLMLQEDIDEEATRNTGVTSGIRPSR